MIAGERNALAQADRGFALLIVLWFLVLMAAIGTYLTANARSETAIAFNIRAAARAEGLADAGIARAAFNLTDTISNRWKLDGAPHRFVLPAGEATIRLHDETQKINPNHASSALLAALFEAAGLDRFRAQRLGVAVAAWVGSGNGAATAQEYRDAGKNYGPPHAPIETIDELQLVLGMTPEILASVRPYMTIHTQSDSPDGKNAPLLVRQALKLAAQPSATDLDMSEAETTSTETIVRIEVTARAADGGIFVRYAVLKIEPADPKGYVVLDWRRGDLGECLSCEPDDADVTG